MTPSTDSLNLYRQLADRYNQLGQFSMRDRFLMLAAAAALEGGQVAEAERLRGQLLQQNRHHMLRPYRSFEEAVRAADVQTYLQDLKTNYPPNLAAQLLLSLEEGKTGTVPAKPLSQPRPAAPKTQTAPSARPAPAPPAPPVPAPAPAPTPAAIPPTAPVVDPYARQDAVDNQVWDSAIPYRMMEEIEQTMPLPDLDLAPMKRPLAQPVPPRPVKSSAPAERPQPRPTMPVQRQASSLPMKFPERIPTPEPERPAVPESSGGAWVCLLLSCLAALGGILIGWFTLARPFLPPEMLP